MRDFNLRFYKPRFPDAMFDVEGDELGDYAKVSGCYVLGSADGTDFVYPWGKSPVFYIGTSKNLSGRLRAHRRWVRRAEDEHHSRHFAPLHQYGASFGVDVAVYRKHTSQNIDKLESALITDFYQIYGSIPVANGTWPKLMRKPIGTTID